MPSPAWPELPESLAADLAKFDPQAFGAALDREILAASGRFADGISAYRAHPYSRPAEHAAAIWRQGSARLYDHGAGTGGVPALFVPSLINRGWVLDLVPGQGMLSWLATQGVHPYRLEWGPPGEEERGFDVAGYIAARLEPALDEVRRRAKGPVVLAGYCMGGLLTLAAALGRPDAVRGLALLAMPWDFHAEAAGRAEAMGGFYRAWRPLLAAWGELPIDLIQGLFALHDPIVALRKFQRMATLDPNSPDAQTFVALEDWLNDGVAVSLPVADEGLIGWYAENETGRGLWRPGGALVDPAELAVPALVVVPGADRIVPPASAAAILPHLTDATRLDLPLGHIGMMVGRRARDALWRPLGEWIRAFG